MRVTRLELNDTVFLHSPARGIERGLRVVGVVDDPAHYLEMSLRLHRPTHHPERPEQLTVLEQHPGDDRVERPPGRRQRVRVARHTAETGGPILEHDPRSRRDNTRAERPVHALDQRHGHAVAVDHAQVRRPAARQPETNVDRCIQPHERTARRKTALGEEVIRQGAVMHHGARV